MENNGLVPMAGIENLAKHYFTMSFNSKKLGGKVTFFIDDITLMAEMPDGQVGEVWSLDGPKGDRTWWKNHWCDIHQDPERYTRNLYNRISRGTVRILKPLA